VKGDRGGGFLEYKRGCGQVLIIKINYQRSKVKLHSRLDKLIKRNGR